MMCFLKKLPAFKKKEWVQMLHALYAKTQMTVFKEYDIKKRFSTKHANYTINLLLGGGRIILQFNCLTEQF